LQARFDILKTVVLTTGLKDLLGSFSSVAQVPLSFFPRVERCLGLKEDGSFMEISEGIARIGYDYKVKKATEDCLFSIHETAAAREKRIAQES